MATGLTTMLHDYFQKIIAAIGEDPNRAGLKDTPKRASDTFSFLTRGYHQSLDDIMNGAIFPSNHESIVLVKNIELYSLCEHHLLPFTGLCHITYEPNGKIIGLSKVARIVDFYARRLQVQERLTQEIASTIQTVTEAKGVGIIIEAQHLCMMMRGVAKQHATMTTSVMLGSLRDNGDARALFLSQIYAAQATHQETITPALIPLSTPQERSK